MAFPSNVVTFVTVVFKVLILGKRMAIPLPAFFEQAGQLVTKALLTALPNGVPYIKLSDPTFALALIATTLPPLVWNTIGPFEYYTRLVSRVVRKPIIGVYLSGSIIAFLSVLRSALFAAAIHEQPKAKELDHPVLFAAAGALFVVGVVFFIGAYYQLGISGTYLGDYFGIFRDERITAFPFSALDNPMYDGSSIFHFAEAVLYVSFE